WLRHDAAIAKMTKDTRGNSFARPSEKVTPLQSQRDCVLQPRVARNELPWEWASGGILPQRGCGFAGQHPATTPLGLTISDLAFPRVARPSQPWALGRNPFGIPSLAVLPRPRLLP